MSGGIDMEWEIIFKPIYVNAKNKDDAIVKAVEEVANGNLEEESVEQCH
jgi:hypothetical protein